MGSILFSHSRLYFLLVLSDATINDRTPTRRKTTKKICRKPTATRHAYGTIAVSPSTAIAESDTTFFFATRRGAALRQIRKIFKSTSRAQKVDENAEPQNVFPQNRVEPLGVLEPEPWPLAVGRWRGDAMRCDALRPLLAIALLSSAFECECVGEGTRTRLCVCV